MQIYKTFSNKKMVHKKNRVPFKNKHLYYEFSNVNKKNVILHKKENYGKEN
jgi:hypothetical protein